jgi:hypothetical protein
MAQRLLNSTYINTGDSDVLFSLRDTDKRILSRRSRFFIRVHHLAALCLAGWVAYLFMVRELL